MKFSSTDRPTDADPGVSSHAVTSLNFCVLSILPGMIINDILLAGLIQNHKSYLITEEGVAPDAIIKLNDQITES